MRYQLALMCSLFGASVAAQIPSAGLRLWLRANAGVSASTDGLVDTWTDQSGAGVVFSQTGTSRPQLLTDSAGDSLLRFQGSQYMDGAIGPTLQTATVFALFRYRGSSDNDYLYTLGAAGRNGSQMTLSRRSPDNAYHYDGRSQNIRGKIPQSRWVVSTQLYGAASAGSHQLRIDGVVQMDTDAGTYATDTSRARLGNWSRAAYGLRGDVRQFIVYDRALNSREIATVETWLASLTAGARFMEYGDACPGTNGTPRLSAASAGPRPGSSFDTATSGMPSGTSVFQLLGFDDTFFQNTAPLPIALDSIGAPTCTLYVSGDVVSPLAAAGGVAPWSLPIPNDSTLLNSCFHVQTVAFDPGANALGVTTSNALTASIGI